ncbi:MAG: TonB-dependent receptor [Sphingobacteriales bacterium]|nr:TonB-dependent receptor [Sphingobacteriales bacterium]
MKPTVSLFIAAILTGSSVLAQGQRIYRPEDTTRAKELNEVVVTATRTERKLTNVAVPVKLIDQRTIQQAGSLRLRDILQEQAGLYMTNGFGAGVQMQGLNPDYTLIMVDGEPLVGRTAGVLDLNRVAVGNIRRIEIVKGPSSSLYGSEAMAGVINVITDNSFKKRLNTGLRYGFGNPDEGWALPGSRKSFDNLDFSLQGSTTIHKIGIQFFSNANYLDGVSFRPFSTERVPQPIWRLTNQLQLNYRISQRTKASFSIRHAYDHIKQEFAVSNNGAVTNSYGREANKDLNSSGTLVHQFSDKVKTALRLYATAYNGSQVLKFREIPDSVYDDEFRQHFYRAENQTDISWEKATLTLGAGYAVDQVNSTRYDEVSSRKQNTIGYGFAQYDWSPSEKFTVIAGIRYDDNKLFAAAVSPKLALRYTVSKKLSLKASAGRGFKAPDFRQLYLNFTNNAAGGYSVFGSIDAVKIIDELNRLGQIAEIREDYSKLKQLTPEYSTGLNAGGTYTPVEPLSITFNFFRNDIENLIDAREVAVRSNGTQIFSYINVKNAYTEGAEMEVRWEWKKFFQVNAGYQFLYTADKADLKKIRSKSVFTRDENGYSRLLERREYSGLPNRSRHMLNLKFCYDDQSFFATFRAIYRGKWVVSDADGNGLYNSHDEFADGFVLFNLSAGRQFKNGIRLQAGMDNALNYRDVNNLPNLPGRMFWLGAQFNLIH